MVTKYAYKYAQAVNVSLVMIFFKTVFEKFPTLSFLQVLMKRKALILVQNRRVNTSTKRFIMPFEQHMRE